MRSERVATIAAGRTAAGRTTIGLLALGLLTLAACAGSSNEASPPIETAGTVVDTAPVDVGEVPRVVAIHPVLRTAVGPCEDFGVGMRVDGRRCLTVAAPIDLGDLGDWVTAATAERQDDLGWSVRLEVDVDGLARAADAFEAAIASFENRFVVVADGRGLLTFEYQALAGSSVVGPLLSEREATIVAAILGGGAWPDLDRRGAEVGDVWTAALGVHVCGEWVTNAPPSDRTTGIGSTGDGLVDVRPTGDGDTGDDATLGRYLETGGWTATEDRLALWDGVDVDSGGTCPDGREASVRWSVDGEERSGDPSDHRIGHRQVIVMSFDPLGESPIDRAEEPPQVASLPVATLAPGPDTTSD